MNRSAKRKTGQSGNASSAKSVTLARWIEKNRLPVTITALAVHLLLCLVMFDPKLHTGGDNAAYILLAESILRLGDGYSLNMNPGAPSPHTLIPLGFPLLLTLPLIVFAKSVVAFKAFITLCSLGSVLFFSLIIRRLASPLLWAALLIAAACNPIMAVSYTHLRAHET